MPCSNCNLSGPTHWYHGSVVSAKEKYHTDVKGRRTYFVECWFHIEIDYPSAYLVKTFISEDMADEQLLKKLLGILLRDPIDTVDEVDFAALQGRCLVGVGRYPGSGYVSATIVDFKPFPLPPGT